MREKTEIISIRLPVGLAAEVRQLTDLPLSRVVRILLVQFRNNERRKHLRSTDTVLIEAPIQPSDLEE